MKVGRAARKLSLPEKRRIADDQDRAEALSVPVIERVATAHGLRWRGGKLARELYPPIVTNKGEGLRRLVETHGLKSVLYFGDDLSDVDAFRLIRQVCQEYQCAGIAIAVTPDAASGLARCADLSVGHPENAQQLIVWIMAHRIGAESKSLNRPAL